MDISIVIPVYNESESIAPLCEQIAQALSSSGRDYEILFIDDGSTDGSFDVIKQMHEKDARVKVIQFRKNFGKSAALDVGFSEAQGEIVFTMDADLQDDPAEIPKFLEKLEQGYDLVTGWKFPRRDPISKTAPSKLFNFTIRKTMGIPIHDFNCGFKAMQRQVSQEIRMYGELHRYIPVLAYWRGFKVAEVKVRHQPRQYGRSKFGPSRFWRGLFDFVTVFFLTQYNRRPLHFFGLFGILAFTAGMIINLYMTYLRFSGEIIGTRPLLLLGVLLVIIGVQFFSFGLLAEMFSFGASARDGDYSIRNKLM